MRLQGKKILLGITGSIAAYKIPYLVRYLVKEGADVHVVMTDVAKDFVTPLVLSTVSTHPVHNQPYESSSGAWDSHVDMGNWADLYLIAPLTTNTLAKMVYGMADNLVVTTYLAAHCPVMFAPAMDLDMYKHPSTQENVKKLIERNNILIQPQEGELASGLVGAGRMEEPEQILERVVDFFLKKRRFADKKVIVTAGPTYENIDAVRFIGNYSSGKMGFAIAETFAEEGAEVLLISGPTSLKPSHPNIHLLHVISAGEMHEAVSERFDDTDIVVMAAAVADYTVKDPATEKLKKKEHSQQITLVPTTDILKELGQRKKSQILVGFALETHDHEKNARAKLQNKNADLLVLNPATEKGAGFNSDTNRVKILTPDGKTKSFEVKTKMEVAADIVDEVALKYFQA
ncbi:MAG: bifunctional phosphopantothenoylcysteine decarboxylase/phosphopantothenate--cysteine ligase CoaBC [Bacteroidales bacterium]|nr:bifunctional phosphopantothenoylcysteine decarboxylase/phosphopantothenate--cysteine ligase CoaBC [Bacteroidales bacterium]MCF8332817.1 bifunctional phosphopantothenoylcysteine decarboxylase/phosphopantothenate--cysteine ligase CoaBC [Bacteroidales bacterium]